MERFNSVTDLFEVSKRLYDIRIKEEIFYAEYKDEQNTASRKRLVNLARQEPGWARQKS